MAYIRTHDLLLAGLTALGASTAMAATRWTTQMTLEDNGWDQSKYPRHLADVNGDGLADLIGHGQSDVYVALSNGTSFGPEQPWYTGSWVYASGWRTTRHLRTSGDVNGDGIADLVGFGTHNMWVSPSTGDRFLAPQNWSPELCYAKGWLPSTHDRAVADVDGDGLADAVGFERDRTWVVLSQGDRFGPRQLWSEGWGVADAFDPARHSRQLGDVDGDGLADAIGFSESGVRVMRSTGAGFAPAYLALDDMGALERGPDAEHPRAVADVDGDGRADVMTFLDEGLLVALSDGETFGPPRIWVDAFGADTGWQARHVRALADVDGNGQADIVAISDAEVRVATAFDLSFDSVLLPLSGGDFATRLVSWDQGRCLTVDGEAVVQHACDAEAPLGWTLTARDDGTHRIAQDGKCLALAPFPPEAAVTFVATASPAACGDDSARWFVERDRHGEVRVRNAFFDGCLRSPPVTDDGVIVETGPCDASDRLLWSTESLRPRTLTSTLRLDATTGCLSQRPGAVYPELDACDSERAGYTLVDDGHGTFQIRNDASGECLRQGSPVSAAPCQPGDPDQRFAMLAQADGRRMLVSQATGRCLAWAFDLMPLPPIRLRMLACDDAQSLNWWHLPELRTTGSLTFSLQNIGTAEGTALVAAYGSGAFVSRDPRLIVAFARRHGLMETEADFLALLGVGQRDEFTQTVGRWDVPLPDDIDAHAELLSISGDYDFGAGTEAGVSLAAVSARLEIAGVRYTEARVLSADARITLRPDGFALSPAVDVVSVESGWGDQDRSYLGVGAGVGSRGFTAGARWGQDGQWGATVPMGVFAVDLYVHEDHVLDALAFGEDVASWAAKATVAAFSSAWGWSAGALDTAFEGVADVVGDIGGAFGDVFNDVEGALGDVIDDLGGAIGSVGGTIGGWFGF